MPANDNSPIKSNETTVQAVGRNAQTVKAAGHPIVTWDNPLDTYDDDGWNAGYWQSTGSSDTGDYSNARNRVTMKRMPSRMTIEHAEHEELAPRRILRKRSSKRQSNPMPSKKKKKLSAAEIYYQKLNEREKLLKKYRLNTMSEVLFMNNIDAYAMEEKECTLCFQWLFCVMNININTSNDTWRKCINVEILTKHLALVAKSIYFFVEQYPEVNIISSDNVSIFSPGFDAVWSPETPKNKIYSPTKIRKIAKNICGMDDAHRVSLNEHLYRSDKMELFKWCNENAVPYRKGVKMPQGNDKEAGKK